ncbi:MAG: serine/threonine protein kinase [Archangiaceae bacterium]|nr:serine/threonine protein kinase [Archangiaceae bacterium]
MNSHGPDCPADEQIVLLVEGKLEPAALQRVQEHVDGCVHCRRLLSALARSGEPATETGGGWGTASEPEVAPGTRVDRYIVLERVGSGGMGVVFSAYDPELKRKIALKFLKERAGDEVPRQRARLLREAQALARISHPNVVHVFDVGYWGAHVFLAIELSEGVTSRQWLAATPRRFGEVLDVFVQAARGLIAVHDAGLLHRDFKLDNLLVEESGRARVTDFGLAWSGPLAPGSEKFVVGTPGFIAPELLQGLSADVRADQFSFAVAFYRAIYGRDPFGTTDAMLEGVRVEWPKVAGVPRWVEAVLKRALSLDPEQRYPSMAALLAALTDEPSRRRRRALAAVAAVGWGRWSRRAGPFAIARRATSARASSRGCGASPTAPRFSTPSRRPGRRSPRRRGRRPSASSIATATCGATSTCGHARPPRFEENSRANRSSFATPAWGRGCARCASCSMRCGRPT